MQHTLYRKYRPESFEQVFGQENVIRTLNSFIQKDKIPHAYLFTGSRGVGKTSVARIFANSLNIKNEDIIEIDAASNRGIDDIRDLRDSVYTMPTLSKYKLYIIDEAHMLTKDASNALLKTLEEPPQHCLFILATTEREKILDTVVSRCQQINFEKPSNEVVADFLVDIALKEGIKLDKVSAMLIAKNARGAFRDSLTLLQKIIDTNTDGKIDLNFINNILGISEIEKTLHSMRLYVNSENESLLDYIQNIKQTSVNPEMFLDSFIDLFRVCMLYRVTKGKMSEIDFGNFDKKSVDEIVNIKPEVFQSKNLIRLLDIYDKVVRSTHPWIYIEAILLEDK